MREAAALAAASCATTTGAIDTTTEDQTVPNTVKLEEDETNHQIHEQQQDETVSQDLILQQPSLPSPQQVTHDSTPTSLQQQHQRRRHQHAIDNHELEEEAEAEPVYQRLYALRLENQRRAEKHITTMEQETAKKISNTHPRILTDKERMAVTKRYYYLFMWTYN